MHEQNGGPYFVDVSDGNNLWSKPIVVIDGHGTGAMQTRFQTPPTARCAAVHADEGGARVVQALALA